ncbi:MAG: flavodoxin family protein [Clostridia bacterium]|nr:flavodoxin family protein [Lachnospiraceae bacterium]NCC00166.1 flavodoxin family protein [Clostridia bacterium]NCD03411.1 flavodoxin family protein [Clostridia bacterium]
MKVILVNGSPHKNGCTNRALEEIQMQLVKEGVDSEIFWIGTSVQGCIGCFRCGQTGKCVFDDKVGEFLNLAKSADAFVFGSAVYYGSATGSITSFMDRVFFSGTGYMEDKPVASVVSCRRGGASEAFAQLNMYYMMNNMPVVSSQYWNQVHGFTPEDVEQDAEGLQTMRTLAINMAWLLKGIEAGREKGLARPKRETWVATNFIR